MVQPELVQIKWEGITRITHNGVEEFHKHKAGEQELNTKSHLLWDSVENSQTGTTNQAAGLGVRILVTLGVGVEIVYPLPHQHGGGLCGAGDILGAGFMGFPL